MWFDLIELQNEPNMMHSGDEDDEFCSVDQFDSMEPNFLQKKNRINSIEFGSILNWLMFIYPIPAYLSRNLQRFY